MKTMTFNKSVISTAVSGALLLSLPGASAAAANSAAAEKGKIEKIEVTANHRSQNIQKVPYNISAVAGETLVAGNIIDSVEMMRNVAGITVVDRGYRNSGNVNGVIIRGVNVDNGTNGDVALSSVPTVGTYVDGTPLYANFILKDIESVEVLRGPQGTLYGSGSLAGTVKYRMNRPDSSEFYGSAGVNYSQTDGSEGNNITTDVMLNIPFSDRVAFRANVGRIDNDGIIDYSNVYQLDDNGAPLAAGGDIVAGGPLFDAVEDADTVEITYGRVSLSFQASDAVSVLLSHQFQDDEIGGRRQATRGTHWVNGSEEQFGEFENGAVMLEPSEREVSLTALEVEWDLGFATLTSSSSMYQHKGSATSDNTGFYAQSNWFADLYYGSPRPMARADRGYDEEAFVQELRLMSNETRNNIDWIVGLFYMDQESLSFQDSFMPGYQAWAGAAFDWWDGMADFGMVFTDNDFHYRRDQSFTDKAIFGELTYHFSDDLRATFGVRSFSNEFDNDTVLSLPIWPFLGAEPEFDSDEDDTLFKFNISYDIDGDTMLYSTIAEGYRRGGANAVPLEGTLAEREAWQTYESDSVVNYEIGLKGYLGGGTHSYTVAAFLIDWDNPQLNTSSSWGFFTVANGDSAQTKGIELELQGYLSDDWHYTLGYAHVNAELTDDFFVPTGVTADAPERLQAPDGAKLPTTPEDTLSLSLDHTYSLNGDMYLITRLNAYYQSESLNYLGDSDKFQADIDGFTLLNASTRLSTDDWDLTLYIKNLTNEEGVTGLISENHMGTDPAEQFFGNSSKDYISLPRTIGVSMSYRF